MGFISDELFGQGGDTGEQAAAYAFSEAKKGMKGATDYAQRQYRKGYGQAAEQLSPYDIGAEVMPVYQQAVMGGYDPSQDPLYQMQVREGLEAVNQGAAASGGLYSGARGEALRDVGAQGAMSAYDRYMGGLQNLMGIGMQTSGQLGNLALGRAETMSDLTLQEADYLNNLLMGQAQTHMDVQQQKNLERQAVHGKMTDFGMNLVGEYIPGMKGVSESWSGQPQQQQMGQQPTQGPVPMADQTGFGGGFLEGATQVAPEAIMKAWG